MNLINTFPAIAAALAFWVFNAQAASNEEIARRLEPVGQVCVQGKECPGVQVTGSQASGATRSVDDVIAKHCQVCHSGVMPNAPKIGDTAAWTERSQKEGGLDGLLAKAITGINAMPPKGTCGDCSDEDLKAAIQTMSGLK
ncbi:cytochrome c5 family protein [Pseudomonas viridiflava]|uniref:c-type cytochrome n=1 Tax=Pseudomonas viridiflava TaxID=33069 RepID=UPI0015E30357|nr:c-type cytochrome [Pseudomonas viridiflava]MBA1231310.1 cytochrome c5 family protein [Pseudomonas viridiflava]